MALDGGKATLQLIAGQWGEAMGPVQSLTGVFMSTIALEAGATVVMPGVLARNVFLYVVRGTVMVGADRASAFHLAELGSEGDHVVLNAETAALVVFGHAAPIGEPVVAHGPFVMNTREEIAAAVADFQAGRFQVLPPD